MANVTGPIGSLPGAFHSVPEGTLCDEHADRPAVKRVQGETDSMGCEQHDMCQQCYDAYKVDCDKLGGASFMGRCDSCKSGVEVPLFAWRDYDEGMAGPVYHQCAACKTARHIREAEAYRKEGRYDDDFHNDSFDYEDRHDSGSDPDDEPNGEPAAYTRELDELDALEAQDNDLWSEPGPLELYVIDDAMRAPGRVSFQTAGGRIVASIPIT